MLVVAVHGGAGFHSPSSEIEVKRALRSACTSAVRRSLEGREASALQTISEAISVLEDEECLNAGFGSNLTVLGTVECDASIMDGRTGDFGAVGAVPGVKHPIQVAHELLRYSKLPDPLGRIPPLTLVSSGARDYASSIGLECPAPESLISPRAKHEWGKWKAQLDAARSTVQTPATGAPEDMPVTMSHLEGLHDRQDTVGAVAWDATSNLAAGVSSGGLLLKLPGRVGEVISRPFTAQDAGRQTGRLVASPIVGAGEHIIRMSLARVVCEAVEAAGDELDVHEVLNRVLGEEFHKLAAQRGEASPQAGVLLLVNESDDDGVGLGNSLPRLWCAFTTDSMAVGYMTSLSQKSSATVLRRPPRAPRAGSNPSVYITALPLDARR